MMVYKLSIVEIPKYCYVIYKINVYNTEVEVLHEKTVGMYTTCI